MMENIRVDAFTEVNGDVNVTSLKDIKTYLQKEVENRSLEFSKTSLDFLQGFDKNSYSIDEDRNYKSYIENYLSVLEDFIKNSASVKDKIGFVHKFNALLNIGTLYNKNSKSLTVTPRHPLMIVNDKVIKAKKFINPNNSTFFSVNGNRYYACLEKIVNEKGGYILNNFFESNVHSCRLIEKIKSCLKEMNYGNDSKKHIKIAIFGELRNEDVLINYFDAENVEVCIDSYRWQSQLSFRLVQDNSNGIDKILDLDDYSDINNLLKSYQLVLFINDPCFYEKTIKDNAIEVTRQVEYFLKDKNLYDNLEDKFYFYYKNACIIKESILAEPIVYKYRKDIIERIKNIYLGERCSSHIYFYISTFGEIENEFKIDNVVVRQELYNQRNLYVHRILNNFSVSQYLIENRQNTIDENKKIKIPVWKLIKNDEYLFVEKKDYKKIRHLMNKYVIVDFSDIFKDSASNDVKKVKVSADIAKETDIIKGYLSKFFSNISDNKAIQLRFANAVFSSCQSMFHIFFSYYYKEIFNKNLQFDELKIEVEEGHIDYNNFSFSDKLILFDVFDQLESLWYSSESALMIELKNKFKEYFVSIDDLSSLMSLISNYSKKFGIQNNISKIYQSYKKE